MHAFLSRAEGNYSKSWGQLFITGSMHAVPIGTTPSIFMTMIKYSHKSSIKNLYMNAPPRLKLELSPETQEVALR